MFRASVRNTFLEVVEQEEEGREVVRRRRTQSADFQLSSATVPLTASTRRMRAMLDSLDALISGSSQKGDLRHLRNDKSSSRWQKQALETGLEKVLSNSSVSTMVPEDWDCADDAAECEMQQVRPSRQGDASHSEQGVSTKGFRHCHVPKSVDLAAESSKGGAPSREPPTTLMIRNLPNRYSQQELIEELECMGFRSSFDFFYAPIDVGTMANCGYAFINFVDAAWAERCQEVMEGYEFEKHQKATKRRAATVSVAHLQGLEANISHYAKAAVGRRARLRRSGPVVLQQGVEGGAERLWKTIC